MNRIPANAIRRLSSRLVKNSMGGSRQVLPTTSFSSRTSFPHCSPFRIQSTSPRFMSSSSKPRPSIASPKHFKADANSADIYAILEPQTSTWQYIVADPVSREAAVIDPVLDYDSASGTLSTSAADGLLTFIAEKGLKVVRFLETHAHADHLSASQYLKKMLGDNIPICIGERIEQVQNHFSPVYGFSSVDSMSSFDVFLKDEEEFMLGNISCRAIHLPGHTPDHLGYVVGKAVFTGDSIFMPDLGSARADFPGGNAKDLYSSIRRLLSLPQDYQLFVGHDYPNGRQHECMATVEAHRATNKHGKLGIAEEEFVRFREARDSILGAPKLLHPSLQVNIRAGRLPPSSGARTWLKTPVRLANPNIPLE
ncbi:hypothetical protein GYMLUDRAFT_37577 [Collybiopsis luxurians FD-317 M1]|nr:hypothetical protein GYMLUDRAFT_37577 [Collybiopsis luxurians FD-317 M1]